MVPTPFTLDPEDDFDDDTNLAPAVIIVTPYSSGCCVAQEIQKRGYKLICLWHAGIPENMKGHVPVSCKGSLKYNMELDEQPTVKETADLVLDAARSCHYRIVACICGGDGGVDLADALSEELGLLTNGTDVPKRRDKKVQQELIKDAGLRSIRQVAGTKFEDVQDFLDRETYPVVIKPLDSAGSDGVKLCHNFAEAKEHFLELTDHHELINGGECQDVLCQEFLKGKEYVVDHVSRDGVHKTCMVWKYDKGNANGAEFIYFGDIPIDSECQEAQLLIPYIRGVLDALGVKNGPSHGEAIITEDGTPCLVEMNCRAHGGDGVWQPLCRGLAGYCQIDASVDSFLYPERFAKLPDKYPSPMLMAGQCVDLVSYSSGIARSTPGYDVLKLLPSFVCLETRIKKGTQVIPTVDMWSDIGSLVLLHANKSVVERDISLIRQMELSNLFFEYEPDKEEEEEDDDDRWVKMKVQGRSRSLDFNPREEEPEWTLLKQKGRSCSLNFFGSSHPVALGHPSKGRTLRRMQPVAENDVFVEKY